MIRRLEIVLAACFYYSGLVKFARWWLMRSGKKLVILCYHQASGGYLRQHMLYLNRYYRILHLETALEELYNPCITKSQSNDRRPPLVLTFDDGYYDSYSSGLSLANELRIPITVFLIPGYIENGNRFWWEELENLLHHSKLHKVMIDERTYRLDKSGDRCALLQAITARLSHATSITDREEFLASLRETFAPSSLPISNNRQAALPLTWDEVYKMGKSQWVSFGAHTMNHPVLAYLTDPAEVQYEVSECRVVLETQIEHRMRIFAYPHGKSEDVGEKAPPAVQQAGYDWAVTTIHGLNTPQTKPYLLYRMVVDVDQHWLQIAVKASGLWDYFMRPFRIPLYFIINVLRRVCVF